LLRAPIVEHKNTSIRKISLKNQYFKHILSLKGAVQQINRKTAQAPSNSKKIDIKHRKLSNCSHSCGVSGSCCKVGCFEEKKTRKKLN